MASGRSARLPPTPQQQAAPPPTTTLTTTFLTTNSAGSPRIFDVSPNNNHPGSVSVTTTTGQSHDMLQQQHQNHPHHPHLHQPYQQQQQHVEQHRHHPGQDIILDNHNSAAHSFGTDLAEATSQVLDCLSDRERRIIINVLKRDDNVRQRDAARIMWVKTIVHTYT